MPFKKGTFPPPPPPAALVISGLTPRAQLLIGRGKINRRLLPEGDIVIFCFKVSLFYLFLPRAGGGAEGLLLSGPEAKDLPWRARPLVTRAAEEGKASVQCMWLSSRWVEGQRFNPF